MNRREETKKKKYIYQLINNQRYKELLERIDNIKELLLRDTQLLFKIIHIYEKLGYDQEAKDLLIYIYENKENIGKAELYKLAEICARLEDTSCIEDVYREYLKNWPQSPERFIIGYYTACTKKDLPENRLHYLEQYCAINLKENWAYELAKLYKELERVDECASMCHDLIFLFGYGDYAQQAVALLQECRDLTETEKDKIVELQVIWEKKSKENKEEKRVLSFRNQMYFKNQRRRDNSELEVKPVILSFENGIPMLHEKEEWNKNNISQKVNSLVSTEIPIKENQTENTDAIFGYEQDTEEAAVMLKIQRHLEKMIAEIEQLYEEDTIKKREFIEEQSKKQPEEMVEISSELKNKTENIPDETEGISSVSLDIGNIEGDIKNDIEMESNHVAEDINENIEIESENIVNKDVNIEEEYSVQQFQTYLMEYAKGQNAELDEMAYLTVTLIADKKQRSGITLTTELAEEMINLAIKRSKTKSALSIKQFKHNKNGKVILDEKCFE